MRLIDADALKETFEIAWKEAWHDREYANAFFSDAGAVSTEWWCVENMVDNAPTIEPQKWIPVSEMLPEEEGFYLVTMDGEICGVDHVFTTTCGFECGEWDEGRVFAWMPLPEPYKEVIENERNVYTRDNGGNV